MLWDVDLSHTKDAEKVLIHILCKVESYLMMLPQSQKYDHHYDLRLLYKPIKMMIYMIDAMTGLTKKIQKIYYCLLQGWFSCGMRWRITWADRWQGRRTPDHPPSPLADYPSPSTTPELVASVPSCWTVLHINGRNSSILKPLKPGFLYFLFLIYSVQLKVISLRLPLVGTLLYIYWDLTSYLAKQQWCWWKEI